MQLNEHQQKVVDEDRKKVIIGWGCGTGKTLVSLSLAKGKTLIVVQKQQKVDKTFENTLIKFNISLDITVVTVDEFRKTHKTLPKFDTLICDEAHTQLSGSVNYFRFKTFFKPSEICKCLLEYVKTHDIERIYLLSATIDASPMVVYNACRILGVQYGVLEWVKAFYLLLNERYKVKKDEATNDMLIKIIQRMGYYMKHEKAPPQIYQQIWVENTPEQAQRIKEIKIEYQDIQQVSKIYQIENGVLKGNQFKSSETFPCLKYDIVKDIIKDHPRIIIWVTYTEQLDRLYETLKDIHPTHTLSGKSKKKDREQLLTSLQSSDNYVLIVNTAINAGWELPHCPTMIFFSLPYSTRSHQRTQAEGRIQRQNNLKVNTYIDIITKGAVNEALYHAQKNGKKFSERIYYNKNI
jgi:superfamily II DNA or RNA helicase